MNFNMELMNVNPENMDENMDKRWIIDAIVKGIIDASLFIALIIVIVLWGFVGMVILGPLLSSKAHAHDVYSGVRGPKGMLCCGGDPVTGDCEALQDQDILVAGDYVIIRSHRYNRTVRVDQSLVVWLPIDGSDAPGHWCGVPRPRDHIEAAFPEQVDMNTWTYCLFISPGGV